MSQALVHGAVMLVETPDKDAVPLVLVTIQCDHCGQATLVFAAHHAKAVARALADCIQALPDQATGDGGTELPNTRTTRPEDN